MKIKLYRHLIKHTEPLPDRDFTYYELTEWSSIANRVLNDELKEVTLDGN